MRSGVGRNLGSKGEISLGRSSGEGLQNANSGRWVAVDATTRVGEGPGLVYLTERGGRGKKIGTVNGCGELSERWKSTLTSSKAAGFQSRRRGSWN